MLSRRYLASYIIKRYINRRTFEIKDRLETSNDLLWKTLEKKSIKSPQDWKDVRNEILNATELRGSVTLSNIDAMTVGICTSMKNYDLAFSYLDFLEKEQIKPNLATIGKYFKLLYVKNVSDGLSQEEQDRILKMYEDVRKNYPILDAPTIENIIQAVSLTKEWKICVKLMEEIKLTSFPTSSSYNALICAAFSNNEDDFAWRVFRELLDQGRDVFSTVYSSYFKKVAKNSNKSDTLRELEVMFNFLQKNNLQLNTDSLESLTDLLKKVRVEIRPSTVTPRGICKYCKSQLRTFDLSNDEFIDLKNKIFQNVIVGKDVFNRTTPDELEKFQNFISTMENFDVVIDGLNVAYSAGVQQPPQVTSGLVAAVVSHFVDQNKKVLVLGRYHMNKWPKQNWGFVLKNATVFLTQNLSQDDPYLLYCALNSGKNTIIVSRDLMRGHKFLLRNAHLKMLFERWLLQRQYQLVRVSESKVPMFKKPQAFSHVAQKTGEYWHVPCTSNTGVRQKSEAQNRWLCIEC